MKLIVSGGGTGGHIYPALALIEAVKKNDPTSQFLFVGSSRGLEVDIVPKSGVAFQGLNIQGFRRSLSFDNIKTVRLFLKSVNEAKKIIDDFKPDVVVGTGGYASGAVLYAASKLKIPTLIHEQNSVPGITNRFLSSRVNKIAISFSQTSKFFPKEKTVLVGNPRGQQLLNELGTVDDLFSMNSINLEEEKPTVLIFGGSQGADAINVATLSAMKYFSKRPYQVIFVTGERRYDTVMKAIEKQKINVEKNIAILPYIENMQQLLPKIKLLIGRSGATTISEITALGIPSILIPSPNVTADHQTKNASELVKVGGAIEIDEPDLTGAMLVHESDRIINQKKIYEKMSEKAKQLGHPNAANELYDLLVSMLPTTNK